MSDLLNQTDPEFDVLGDVLNTLRIRGSIFFRSELAAPWGISLAELGIPRFHIALSGSCFVGAAGAGAVGVEEMSIVVLPNGNSHWIADQPGRDLETDKRAGEACELGNPLFQQGKITNRIMCGLIQFDQESSHPVFASLPPILYFPELGPSEPIWMTVKLIESEMCGAYDLGGPIVDRLSEVLFLQLLYRYLSESDEDAGFIAALRDRRIHQALTLIHRAPNVGWSLETLGERTGMSRATLTRHFQDAVGVAPMTYVTNWRVMKAYNLTKYSTSTLEEIAEAVGFVSARTLSKAFQRHYGYTPSELRRIKNGS